MTIEEYNAQVLQEIFAPTPPPREECHYCGKTYCVDFNINPGHELGRIRDMYVTFHGYKR